MLPGTVPDNATGRLLLAARRSLFSLHTYIDTKKVKPKVLSEPKSPQGGVDLRFLSPQPDPSLHCDVTTDTGPVHREVCVFTSQL